QAWAIAIVIACRSSGVIQYLLARREWLARSSSPSKNAEQIFSCYFSYLCRFVDVVIGPEVMDYAVLPDLNLPFTSAGIDVAYSGFTAFQWTTPVVIVLRSRG